MFISPKSLASKSVAQSLAGPMMSRRATLAGMGAAVAFGNSTVAFGASGASQRLVVLNIRGGLDGLAAVVPYGDPSLAGLRTGLVPTGLQKIDPFFALHPSLVNLYGMFRSGEALAVHAVGPCVATRSHFEGQDYLQCGTGQLLSTGWLNRALGQLPATSGMQVGVSVNSDTPLVLRGATPTAGWSVEPYGQTPSEITARLVGVTASDPQIGPAAAIGVSDRVAFDQMLANATSSPTSSLTQLATVAGTLLAAVSGPRVAVLQTDTVDTHDEQNGRLPAMLGGIDAAIGALKTSLGSAWANTVVLTMTEFGRTAYCNGTNGTDHGTGFAVFLAGGAVAGGRVLGRWPGLTSGQLFQGRDLAPTTDFRSIAMGVLSGHLGINASAQPGIFPGSGGIVPMTGLVTS